jgi:hypothetical protein
MDSAVASSAGPSTIAHRAVFGFNPADFSEMDRNELVEISHFLSEHNYKVEVQDWAFLAPVQRTEQAQHKNRSKQLIST